MDESNNPQEISGATENDSLGSSENDPLDISELASLNEDISVDFIEQLQNQLEQSTGTKAPKKVSMDTDDTELFEEVPAKKPTWNEDIDDNFMKKYKAKLLKQQQNAVKEEDAKKSTPSQPAIQEEPTIDTDPINNLTEETASQQINDIKTPETDIQSLQSETVQNTTDEAPQAEKIESISGGNIIEKPLNKAQVDYNQSLDYLDNNTKYSKYVIYIDPENKEFIDSLTVKERKNLINRIIREQDSVIVTKKNLSKMQTILTHLIIAILTVTISVPCIYWVFNISLESTINNYRSSQKMFQTLYKEHGKIKSQR